MPEATLLGDEGTTYLYRFGNRAYEFRGNVACPVPPAVALDLKKRKDKNGESLFKIEGLPRIIVPTREDAGTVRARAAKRRVSRVDVAPVTEKSPVPPVEQLVIASGGPQQLQMELWL